MTDHLNKGAPHDDDGTPLDGTALLAGIGHVRHRHRGLHDRAAAARSGPRPVREPRQRGTAGDGVRAHLCAQFAGPDGAHGRYRPQAAADRLDAGVRGGEFRRMVGARLLGPVGGAHPARRRGRPLCPERQCLGERPRRAVAARHGPVDRHRRHRASRSRWACLSARSSATASAGV